MLTSTRPGSQSTLQLYINYKCCLYGAGRKYFDVGKYISRDIEGGWAPKIETFWALQFQRAKQLPFGPKKVIPPPPPNSPSYRGRILGSNRDKSLDVFPPCYSQSPQLTESPLSKSGLKLVFNVNIVSGNLKSENYARNLNEIVLS